MSMYASVWAFSYLGGVIVLYLGIIALLEGAMLWAGALVALSFVPLLLDYRDKHGWLFTGKKA